MAEIPASHRYLLDSPVATFATIGPDGRPQVSEVWFLADGDDLKMSLNTSRQKVRNVERNPACALFILDLTNPFKYLEVRGDAEIVADDDHAFADRVGAKYGADLREHDRPGERRVVVTVRPSKINAVDMTAG